MKVYEYEKCSTCRKALKFLNRNGIKYQSVPIVVSPPSLSEIKKMAKYLKESGKDVRRLLNTSGQLYRELDLKNRLPHMTEEDLLQLLSQNGKLIKRPFLWTGSKGLLGFKEDEWKALLEVEQ